MNVGAAEIGAVRADIPAAIALLGPEAESDVATALGVASPSQRAAIESEPGPLLVLAGPGAGKTFCLIERIRFLVERRGFDPARICAFTFTNKAAGEIASRLERHLGPHTQRVKRGTIHAFCAELLREFGPHVQLRPGFGIASEDYQLSVLQRLQGQRPWHRTVLKRFSAHRLAGEPLQHDDVVLLDGYERFLAKRNLLDFDMLVLKAAQLLESACATEIRQRWDAILIDEFQDLNPVQYRIIRELGREHHHVFGVGDDEQSIYSWAGADPAVFRSFIHDFKIALKIPLVENRRCPRAAFALARRLIAANTPLFADRVPPVADRDSEYPVAAYTFENESVEFSWIVEDIRRDHVQHGHDWGDVAVLYRKHEIGEGLEAAFVNAGIPCRLAKGRALAEEPVIAHVLAALRVIAKPTDDVYRDEFFAIVLPKSLFDEARAQAEAAGHDLRRQLNHMAFHGPRADESGRQIRRALRTWRNLEAMGRRHTSVHALVQEVLSQRVGRLRSILEENEDELTDPASHPDVVELADRLREARQRRSEVWIASLGGAEIPLKGILSAIGVTRVRRGNSPPPRAERIATEATPALGVAVGLFKAAQLLELGELSSAFGDFTAVDLETTDHNAGRAEIVEVAAVRVRNGRITDTFSSLVKPRGSIPPSATDVHGIRDCDVAAAPSFETVWPSLRAFCGDDVIVAHNGYEFDFMILKRMTKSFGQRFDMCTYDTLPLARDLYPTSRKLRDLASQFAIPSGRSHSAADDARTLAEVFLKLDEAKRSRARKSALITVLDQLGVALSLTDKSSLCPEAQVLRRIARPFALGRYSSCLEFYEREQAGDESVPSVDEVIERLGGAKLMVKIRSEKSAEERYPETMLRLRRLIAEIPEGTLAQQLDVFLERAVLSKLDGVDPARGRVNLLTLHSTKGLEFSRVYVVGAEDGQLPGSLPTSSPTVQEIEEARRLLYVGMTRVKDRLVLTRVEARGGKPTGGHRFLDEMELRPVHP